MANSFNNHRNLTDRKLQSIIEVMLAINNNFSKDQLLKIYGSILRNQINFQRYVVYSCSPNGRLQLEVFGGVNDEQLNSINVEGYLLKLTDHQEIYYLSDSSFNFFDAVIPIFHKNTILAYVLVGNDNEEDHPSELKDDIRFVQALTNIIYVAFENKNLAREKLKQESLKKELELASEMQNMLLPAEFQKCEKLEVDAFYKSHAEIGGDYYDFFKLNEEEFAICIADVSGKGVSAALLMSNFQANVRALYEYIPSLEELAQVLNKKVMENAKGEKFITAFLAKYNVQTRVLRFLNAGHNPPILVSGNKLEMLHEGSIGLGMLDELPFIKKSEKIVDPGSLLVCYTDGLTDLENNDGKYFGVEALKEMIRDNRNLSPYELTPCVLRQLEYFKQDQMYKDDIAFLSCRFL